MTNGERRASPAMSEVSDLIAKVSSPADLAVVLLAGTAGLVIDATVTAIGFPSPGIAAFAFAGGALGLKKAGEATFGSRASNELGVVERAEELRDLLTDVERDEGGYSGPLNDLLLSLALRRRGIISDDALEVELDKALTE